MQRMPPPLALAIPLLAGAVALTAAMCGGTPRQGTGPGGDSAPPPPDTTPVGATCTGTAGLTLPPGFCATIFADHVGAARHITVAPSGDVFVQLASPAQGTSGGIVALRDTNRDAVADIVQRFGTPGGTGIGIYHGYLYSDERSRIVRYPLPAGQLEPSGPAETIVSGLPTGGHGARNFTFDSTGHLYVNVGSGTNSCQVNDRSYESPGIDPCPELATRAAIWRFEAATAGQTLSSGVRFATGIRNAMGLAIDPLNGALYATQHGRDQLYQNWSRYFDAQQSAEDPAEEFMQVSQGDDFGWPYCFYEDLTAKSLVLAPEYGGNGTTVGRCAGKKEPLAWFPGHWAPMALTFYTGSQFPAHYHGGAFIAFHGSWNRAPLPQEGYRVDFVPIANGQPSGQYETFAIGFQNGSAQPGGALHRPDGVAQAPDGSLFISDDAAGRIWEVRYLPAH